MHRKELLRDLIAVAVALTMTVGYAVVLASAFSHSYPAREAGFSVPARQAGSLELPVQTDLARAGTDITLRVHRS